MKPHCETCITKDACVLAQKCLDNPYIKSYDTLSEMHPNVLASRIVKSLILAEGNLNKYKEILANALSLLQKERGGYTAVNSCEGGALCVDVSKILDSKIYIVRGPEMFCFVLPPLPEPVIRGTGASVIEEILGDTKDAPPEPPCTKCGKVEQGPCGEVFCARLRSA